MWKYAALISYVGTQYCGWQKQKGSAAAGLPSIQTTVEQALSRITSEEVTIVGSGRTDSGVHALGQVAHFRLTKKEWDPRILQRGMNSALPIEIRALAVQPVDNGFSRAALGGEKAVQLFLPTGSVRDSAPRAFQLVDSQKAKRRGDAAGTGSAAWRIRFQAVSIVGRQAGTDGDEKFWRPKSRESARCFRACHILRVEFVRIRVVGTGFLKQMVRGIAGTMLQIGEGRRPADDIQRILSSGDRS